MKQKMKRSENVDFFEEEIHPEQDETGFLDGENENISNKIKTNSLNRFVPKDAEQIEEEDKIKKQNFIDESSK